VARDAAIDHRAAPRGGRRGRHRGRRERQRGAPRDGFGRGSAAGIPPRGAERDAAGRSAHAADPWRAPAHARRAPGGCRRPLTRRAGTPRAAGGLSEVSKETSMSAVPQPQQKSPLTDVKTLREQARKHVEEGAVTENYRANKEKVLQLL